jgi:hypothetical protein
MVESNFSFNGDLSLEAELEGAARAAELADRIETAAGETLDTDKRMIVMDIFAPGIAHFSDIARHAGELANEGDILGAFKLMGGEANARELIGDEFVDELLAELAEQANDIDPNRD